MVLVFVGCLLTPLVIFVWKFNHAPISSDPTMWGVFGDYVGGVLNPLLAVITLGVTLYIASVAHRFEKQREIEKAQPFADIRCSDYENLIKVFVQNLGIGPLLIDQIDMFLINQPENKVKNLIELMPKCPEGVLWKYFTIKGLPPIIHERSYARLLELEGDIDNEIFKKFRDEVRSRLSEVRIELNYSDIYRNKKEPITIDLKEWFGRHTATPFENGHDATKAS